MAVSGEYASDEWFLANAFPKADPGEVIRVRAALLYIRTMHGDGFMDRCADILTTGSKSAQNYAWSAFKYNVVNDTTTAVLRNKGNSPKYTAGMLKKIETSTFSEVVQAWSYGSIVDELTVRTPYNVKVEHEENRAIINAYLHDVTTPIILVDQAYWRGVAVLAVKGITKPKSYSMNDRKRLLAMVCWIGNQQDLKPIAKALEERGMTDLDTLRAIVKVQSDLAVPLHDGAL